MLLQEIVNRLGEISVEELQGVLDNVDGKKPTQRLLAVIAYKNGVMKRGGIKLLKPRRSVAEADEDEQEVFHGELKKAAGDECHRSLHRPNQKIRPS